MCMFLQLDLYLGMHIAIRLQTLCYRLALPALQSRSEFGSSVTDARSAQYVAPVAPLIYAACNHCKGCATLHKLVRQITLSEKRSQEWCRTCFCSVKASVSVLNMHALLDQMVADHTLSRVV